MTTTTEKQEFWKSPAGRIHGMRSCSGGSSVKRMRKVRLTREEFEALGRMSPEVSKSRCLCATWRTR